MAEVPLNSVEIVGRVEDISGKPFAGAQVFVPRVQYCEPVAVSDTDGEFKFRVARERYKNGFKVIAKTKSSELQAYSSILPTYSWQEERSRDNLVVLVMKPTRTVEIAVENEAGKRVSNAQVRAMLSTEEYVFKGKTDKSGVVYMALPQDSQLQYLFAFKPYIGMGIKQFGESVVDASTSEEIRPAKRIDDHVTVSLDPPINQLRVKIEDSDGNPLEGVSVYPKDWPLVIGEDRKGRSVSIIHMPVQHVDEFRAVSDASGIAKFEWLTLPEFGLTFGAHSQKYSAVSDVEFEWNYQFGAGYDFIIKMQKTIRLKGTVKNRQGDLMKNYQVRYAWVESNQQRDLGQNLLHTDKDGGFSLDVRPDRSYVLMANDKGTVSRTHNVIIDSMNEMPQEIEFVVEKGNQVTGRVTDLKGKPIADKTVLLFFTGDPLPSLLETFKERVKAQEQKEKEEEEDAEKGDDTEKENVVEEVEVTEEMIRQSSPSGAILLTTDSKGRYDFNLAEGNYGIACGPADQVHFFSIPQDAPLEFDFVLP